jgi:hypothetical protein
MLAQMLGQHQSIFAAGELSNLWWANAHGAHCECGDLVSNCSFWEPVIEETRGASGLAPAQAERLRMAVARDRNNLHRRHRRQRSLVRPSSAQSEYASLRSLVINAVQKSAQASVIVDTSKRALESTYVASRLNVLNVHIIRDPFAVAASEVDATRFLNLDPVDRPPVRSAASSAMLWTFANYQASRIAARSAHLPDAIELERLVNSPLPFLERIVASAGLEPHEWLSREGSFFMQPGHMVAGNPSRTSSGWQPLRKSDRADLKLSRLQRVSVACLARRIGFK